MVDDLIEVIDPDGNHHRISKAHRDRWPSVAATFRLASETKATPVAEEVASATVNPPTGDKKKEN